MPGGGGGGGGGGKIQYTRTHARPHARMHAPTHTHKHVKGLVSKCQNVQAGAGKGLNLQFWFSASSIREAMPSSTVGTANNKTGKQKQNKINR